MKVLFCCCHHFVVEQQIGSTGFSSLTVDRVVHKTILEDDIVHGKVASRHNQIVTLT